MTSDAESSVDTAPSASPAHPLSEVIRDATAVDRAIYKAIATTPTPSLDAAMKRLSRTADHSALWLAMAGVLALVPGRSRRAAEAGVASIAVASLTTNLVGKTLVNRRRPDRAAALVPAARHVRLPHSPSFPSGHSASAFAFAAAVGHQIPALSLPLGLAATAVAYSRVHTGVHYPLDTIVGASVGTAAASAATYLIGRRRPPSHPGLVR